MDPSLAPRKTVADLIREDQGSGFRDGRNDWETQYPGLLDALDEADKEEIGPEEYTRKLLNSVKDIPEFLQAYEKLDEDLRQMLKDFMEGKGADEVTKGGFKLRLTYPEVEMESVAVGETRAVHLADDDSMTVLENEPFQNWGRTVNNTPEYTYIPTTVSDVQKIVRDAKEMGKRVRVAGFRHTWSNMYSKDNELLISLMRLTLATGSSSDVWADAIDGPPTDFNKISLFNEDVPGSGGKKRWATIGAAVTNEAFRCWSIKSGWTLPLNVIMVEITFGGGNAPICHGAGITHNTLSDLVREINYVDANGKTQSVSDPEKLKAAAGSFGLLGIVTHMVIELDKMTYANLEPLKQDVRLAIPPPVAYKVPAAVEWDISDEERKAAESEFIRKANSYYSEWFWFPYNSRVWVNCWDNTVDGTDAVDFPSNAAVFIQWVESFAADKLNASWLFRKLPGRLQGLTNGTSAMTLLPPTILSSGNVKTPLIDGLHFRRGIQNFHVLCVELDIPIPPLADDSTVPDWSVVQRAWWDAISIVYDDQKKTGALRVVLELRIMGGSSNMIMAPQANNKFGTASIEVITNLAAGSENVWQPFVQKLVDAWTAYEVNGKKLNVRPHWAKEWEGYEVDGVAMKQHLKEVAYKDEIKQFQDVLSSIGKDQGWGLQDIKERFSNPLLDYLYFE